MEDIFNLDSVASKLRELEERWGCRYGFGVAPLRLAELVIWGEDVGLHVVPAPEVTFATIHDMYGARHVYINPRLEEGEKRMAIAHELSHMLSRDYKDEFFPKAFAHNCLIPHVEMKTHEDEWGKMSPNRLYESRGPWEMGSAERAAQVCIERVGIYRVLSKYESLI